MAYAKSLLNSAKLGRLHLLAVKPECLTSILIVYQNSSTRLLNRPFCIHHASCSSVCLALLTVRSCTYGLVILAKSEKYRSYGRQGKGFVRNFLFQFHEGYQLKASIWTRELKSEVDRSNVHQTLGRRQTFRAIRCYPVV